MKSFFLNEDAERAFGFAQAIAHGDRLQVSGVLAVDQNYAPTCEGDMHGQLRCVYDRVSEILNAHGKSFGDVLKETIFVTDMDAFLEWNSIRLDAYDGHAPSCTAVQVQRLAFSPCMVEVEMVVAL